MTNFVCLSVCHIRILHFAPICVITPSSPRTIHSTRDIFRRCHGHLGILGVKYTGWTTFYHTSPLSLSLSRQLYRTVLEPALRQVVSVLQCQYYYLCAEAVGRRSDWMHPGITCQIGMLSPGAEKGKSCVILLS